MVTNHYNRLIILERLHQLPKSVKDACGKIILKKVFGLFIQYSIFHLTIYGRMTGIFAKPRQGDFKLLIYSAHESRPALNQ